VGIYSHGRPPRPPVEHLDVLVVGAGISGIGAGRYLRTELPATSFAILEAREASGGTWDLFRYPGVRSDSDLHTFGYEFKPWRDEQSIADAPRILRYLRETIAENGLDAPIRYCHRVLAASWSTAEARWLVDVERTDTGQRLQLSAGWLFCAAGYYRYEEGHTPDFAGRDRFRGPVAHPQHWPEDLEYAGKRVLVIGSGATAVTLVPAMAATAAHVTMLQRTPSYVLPVPRTDVLATMLRAVLGEERGYALPGARTSPVASPSGGSARGTEGGAEADPLGQRPAAAGGLSGRRALPPAVRPVGPAAVRRPGR
jgi:monooxygenase